MGHCGCREIHVSSELCHGCKRTGNKCPKKCPHLCGMWGFDCLDLSLSGATLLRGEKERMDMIFGPGTPKSNNRCTEHPVVPNPKSLC